jgi:hypothetical protein
VLAHAVNVAFASGLRAVGRRALRLAILPLALAPLVPLATGCADWHKYWDRSPMKPVIRRDASPPTVHVLSPAGPDAARATPVSGAAYTIVIGAEDSTGVARVALHLDAEPAAAVSGPPWEFRWNTTGLPEASVHRLWAVAVDGAGNLGVSDTVYAQVFNAGPQVVLDEPLDGALAKETIPVTASFPGPTPQIRDVEFLVDAATLGTVAAAPWSVALDTRTIAPGDHFLAARATTTLGQVGVSQPVRIRVNNGTPQVTIAFPPSGHRVATRGTLILSGAATDAVEGAIADARFRWRSSLDGALGTGPYLRRSGLSVGTHTITASALNAWGTADSIAIQVEVAALPTYRFCANVYGEMLRLRCALACHKVGGTDWALHQLDLKTYAGMMAGGITRSYECVAPCRPESSFVWNKLTAGVPWIGGPMPPSGYSPVPDSTLNKVRVWILEGAPPDAPEICP